jgi:hypothetical protein
MIKKIGGGAKPQPTAAPAPAQNNVAPSGQNAGMSYEEAERII